MTEKSPASAAHNEQQTLNPVAAGDAGADDTTQQPQQPGVHGSPHKEQQQPGEDAEGSNNSNSGEQRSDSRPDGQPHTEGMGDAS